VALVLQGNGNVLVARIKACGDDLLMSADLGMALLTFDSLLLPPGFLFLRCGSFV